MRSNEDLFKQLKKLSKQANQRIVRLEREFGVDSWAVKQLKRKLDNQAVSGWTSGGRVRVAKSMDRQQMLATIRATEKFIHSTTSRVKGAREVLQSNREKIAIGLDMEADKIDEEDVQKFIDIANESRSSILDKIDPSTFFAIVDYCKEINAPFTKFKELLEQYITIGNDVDLIKDAIYLYNKYVKGE